MRKLQNNKRMKIISSEIEKEICDIVEKMIQNNEERVTTKDAKVIRDAIIPEIDKLISQKIKKHIRLLAEYVLTNLKE